MNSIRAAALSAPATTKMAEHKAPVRFGMKRTTGGSMRKRAGFTLKELLAVMALVVTIPVVGGIALYKGVSNRYQNNQQAVTNGFNTAADKEKFVLQTLQDPNIKWGGGDKALELIGQLPNHASKARVIVQMLDYDIPKTYGENSAYQKAALTIGNFGMRSKIQELINNRPGNYQANAEIYSRTKAELAKELGLK